MTASVSPRVVAASSDADSRPLSSLLRTMVTIGCEQIAQAKTRQNDIALNLITLLSHGIGSELQLFEGNKVVTSRTTRTLRKM